MKPEEKLLFKILGEPLEPRKVLESVDGKTLMQTFNEVFDEMELNVKGAPAFTTRFRRILTFRFGLDGGRCRTLEDVGKEFGVTHETIRANEAKALRYLRHPKRSRRLRNFIPSRAW